MQINWEGREYTYDPTKLDVATAMVIRERTGGANGGWGLKTWTNRIDDGDPVALQLLLWAIKRQNGEACDPLSLEFEVPKLILELGRASMEELKAQALAAAGAEKKAEGRKTPRPRQSANAKRSSAPTPT